MTKILLTGATGTVGSQLLDRLLDAGADLRVGARDPARVNPRGAEVVHLDLDDDASVAAALDGVQRAMLLSPFTPEFHRATARHIAAAAAAGIEHLVRISALGADPGSPLAVGQWHGQADAALVDSGLGYTILQPTFFADNLIKFHAATIRKDRAFYGASAGGATSYISSADIADAAAAILLAPAPHAGQTYVLTGGEAVTDTELAALVSDAVGAQVSYVDLPADTLRAGMISAGTPEWLADSLVGLEGVKAAGYASDVSPAARDITGRPPETLPAFLARHAAELG